MQRMQVPPIVTHEESTKYSVNGLECKKEEIYQTILDRRFFDGEINLEKEFHGKDSVDGYNPSGLLFSLNTGLPISLGMPTKSSRKRDTSANFSLDVRSFVAKHNPNEEDFKTLITKMIHCLDMFFEATINFKDHYEHMSIAIKQCMSFFLEKVTNHTDPYNALSNQIALTLYVAAFEMLAYGLSTWMNENLEGNAPKLDVSTPATKEKYSDDLEPRMKSKFIHGYLDALVTKMKSQEDHWLQNASIRSNQRLHAEVKGMFGGHINKLRALQDNVKSEDERQHISHDSKLGGFMRKFHHRTPSSEAAGNDHNKKGYNI